MLHMPWQWPKCYKLQGNPVKSRNVFLEITLAQEQSVKTHKMRDISTVWICCLLTEIQVLLLFVTNLNEKWINQFGIGQISQADNILKPSVVVTKQNDTDWEKETLTNYWLLSPCLMMAKNLRGIVKIGVLMSLWINSL